MTCGSIRSGLGRTPSPPLALSHSHISLMLKSLSAAFAGERVGPIAKQCRAGSPPHLGEVVGVMEAVCGYTKMTHLTQPLPPQRAGGEGLEHERYVNVIAAVCHETTSQFTSSFSPSL